jgi:tetratricopeptide (TPR) repeat protein
MVRTASRNGQVATTLLLAERLLGERPDDLGVLLDYADTLYHVTRYEEAIRVYLRAAELRENARAPIYGALGHLHRYRGDYAQAERWYQSAIEVSPHDAGGYIFLGGVQARQGKLNEAEATHRAATNCTEGCIDEANLNLGLVLRGQGHLREAAECFRKAIELTADYAEAIDALEDVETALAFLADDPAPGAP